MPQERTPAIRLSFAAPRRFSWSALLLIGAGCADTVFVPKESASADTGSCEELWYLDGDGDGYGAPDGLTQCGPGGSYVQDTSDCDDEDAAVYPGAEERCDGIDQDCDGDIDEDTGELFYRDSDGDGYGDSSNATVACEAPEGYLSTSGDCDDSDAEVHPEAEEICNGVDDNCNDEIDEATKGGTEWWLDADFDGYGDPETSIFACDQPKGYADNDDDCDDGTASTYPGATDGCNGVDEDCDGEVDEDAMVGWWMASANTEAGVVVSIDQSDAATDIVSEISTDHDFNTVNVREDGLSVAQDYVTREFWAMDPCTGDTTLIGPTNVGPMCGIAFGPTGLLYGLDYESDELAEFNLDKGTSRVVGSLGFDLSLCGLAYDCQNERLIGTDAETGQIFDVDVVTGEASKFVPSGVDFAQAGLEYDPRDQLLYASTRNELYTIDPVTGATLFVGNINASAVDDLGLHPECPK